MTAPGTSTDGSGAPAFVTRLDGPAVERDLARDLARRGVWIVPAVLAFGAIGWGVHGALSAGFALALVLVNFAMAAALLSWSARISLALMMGAALGGYLLRLALIGGAVLLVVHQPWVEVWPLGLTLVIAHLGLLLWELRYVSATLAFPGLKPPAAR